MDFVFKLKFGKDLTKNNLIIYYHENEILKKIINHSIGMNFIYDNKNIREKQ